MMNGPEKTDSAIVAMKPANKAEGPSAARAVGEPYAAEPVERRAGTKGNAGQQSTRRTQSRESVSSPDTSNERPAVVCLAVKPVGKPGAGNRHARFDERGG